MPEIPEMPTDATPQQKEKWFRDYKSFLLQQKNDEDNARTLARHGIKVEQAR